MIDERTRRLFRIALADWRFPVSVVFLAVFASIVVLRIRDPALAPWVGVYGYYRVFWVLLLAGAIGMILLIRRRAVPWSVVLVFAWCFAAAPVALSLIWNEPYGLHDPWIHLTEINAGTLDPTRNPYPLFHSLVIVLSELTSVTHRTVLMRIPAVAVLAGGTFLFVAIRRHSAPRIARQTAIVVLVPALFLGFVPRPFTLALPFALLFYWYLFAVVPESVPEWRRMAVGLFFVATVYLHPLAAFVLLAIGGCAWLLTNHRSPLGDRGWNVHPYVVLAIATVLFAHLVLSTGIGQQIIESVFVDSATAAGGQDNQNVGIIARAFSSPSKFGETVLRSSYPLTIAGAVAGSLLNELRTRRFDPTTIVSAITAGLAVGAFIGSTVVIPVGVGLTRIFELAPIVAAPAIVRALDRKERTGYEIVVVVLALLIVLGGSISAYQSRLIGGAEYSANGQQVAAIDWMVGHDPVQIVGTDMTFWILEGRYGLGRSTNLSATSASGSYISGHRNASYSWNVSDREPGALYVIDGVERTRARQVAIEGDRTPVRCYRLFEYGQNRIYQNDDTGVYIRTHNTTEACVRTERTARRSRNTVAV